MLIKYTCQEGSCLIELLIVSVIMGILMFVAVPTFNGLVWKAKNVVCTVNRSELENMVSIYTSADSPDSVRGFLAEYLAEYGDNLCPDGGKFSYRNGKVACDLHIPDEQDSDESSACLNNRLAFLDYYNRYLYLNSAIKSIPTKITIKTEAVPKSG